METKHTPGPWFTKREGWSTVYVEARLRGSMLQEVAACGPTQAGPEQQEANAELIAAAPELLIAAINLLAIGRLKWGNLDPDANTIFEQAEALIGRLNP